MQNQASHNARAFARTLRQSMTDGEQRLWRALRAGQLGGKFRRQHPLGSYVADFACLAPRLIVELDGSQHVYQQAYDARRDLFFRQQGFEVMRFPANLPFLDFPALVEAIYQRLTELRALAPIPAFPQRGKELKPKTEAEPGRDLDAPVFLLPPLGEGRDGGLPDPEPRNSKNQALNNSSRKSTP